MSLTKVTVDCTRCKFTIIQEIISNSCENYIYCPSCDNVFMYEKSKQDNIKINNLIEENLEKAYNEIPHIFIKTELIYLKGHINGHEIYFLIDTGAETSVIPANMVQACGLENIMDNNYSGVMKGVGVANVLGKVHYVEVILECGLYPCSFYVCSNNNLPPILGIDMMHNLGISIDFKKKQIKFDNGCNIAFINKADTITSK